MQIYCLIAKCYQRLGNFPDMLQAAKYAIEIDETSVKANVTLAEYHVEIGQVSADEIAI